LKEKDVENQLKDKPGSVSHCHLKKVNEIPAAGIHALVTACPAGVMTMAKTAEKAPFIILRYHPAGLESYAASDRRPIGGHVR